MLHSSLRFPMIAICQNRWGFANVSIPCPPSDWQVALRAWMSGDGREWTSAWETQRWWGNVDATSTSDTAFLWLSMGEGPWAKKSLHLSVPWSTFSQEWVMISAFWSVEEKHCRWTKFTSLLFYCFLTDGKMANHHIRQSSAFLQHGFIFSQGKDKNISPFLWRILPHEEEISLLISYFSGLFKWKHSHIFYSETIVLKFLISEKGFR